ncbi:hypothetical protein EVG20_g10969 [Dentipellis fragilis]|uniref:Uncharacterized protein n=1 Tax=Dentipellis fragilis TaxID=205917 RepID=A0A4Y9XP31_9AGAM|nr:hypothetical protein EVG20_g10969 [Dentipellis fragilis]
MADAFPIDEAQIVALFLESLFYGTYLVTFGMCMYSLIQRSKNDGFRHWPLFVVAILLFTFATLDVAFLVRHVLDAFIWYRGPGGAKGEFADISYWVNVMKTVDYAAQTSIADGMLIYRCYIVYGRNWMIAAALSVLWVAGMTVEAITCYIEFTLHQNAFLNAGVLSPFITSVLSITLVLNLIATALIVHRIWSLQRRTRDLFVDSRGGQSGGGALTRAMRIIIESGTMYSVSVIVFFAVYLANNNAQYGVSDCVRGPLSESTCCCSLWSALCTGRRPVTVLPLIVVHVHVYQGIAFNLIIIRVEQNKTIEITAHGAHSSERVGSGGKPPEVISLHFRRGRVGTGHTGFSSNPSETVESSLGESGSGSGSGKMDIGWSMSANESDEDKIGRMDASVRV